MMMNEFETAGLNNNIIDDYKETETCAKRVMPALFAWFLLISASSTYFSVVFPLFINLIGPTKDGGGGGGGGGDPFYFYLVAAVHAAVFLFTIVNFIISTFMDPGRFPKVNENIDEFYLKQLNAGSGSSTYRNVLINDVNVRMKWCTTCQFFRPPRSSHCGVCNACIDTMDHHCPWICNCIAKRNYRYFLLFLLSLTVHMTLILGFSITLVFTKKDELTQLPVIVAVFMIVIVGILIIPIAGLTGFHLVLVSRGRTTNEQVTGKFRTGVNPFDLGCCVNWNRILCTSVAPSYTRFVNEARKKREYLEAMLIMNKGGGGGGGVGGGIKIGDNAAIVNANKTNSSKLKYINGKNQGYLNQQEAANNLLLNHLTNNTAITTQQDVEETKKPPTITKKKKKSNRKPAAVEDAIAAGQDGDGVNNHHQHQYFSLADHDEPEPSAAVQSVWVNRESFRLNHHQKPQPQQKQQQRSTSKDRGGSSKRNNNSNGFASAAKYNYDNLQQTNANAAAALVDQQRIYEEEVPIQIIKSVKASSTNKMNALNREKQISKQLAAAIANGTNKDPFGSQFARTNSYAKANYITENNYLLSTMNDMAAELAMTASTTSSQQPLTASSSSSSNNRRSLKSSSASTNGGRSQSRNNHLKQKQQQSQPFYSPRDDQQATALLLAGGGGGGGNQQQDQMTSTASTTTTASPDYASYEITV